MKRFSKYIVLTLLISSIASPGLQAKQISPENARQNAIAHFAKSRKTKGKNAANLAVLQTLNLAGTVKDSKSIPLYYIFSRGNDKGFVITAADDRIAPVLGYTDRGTFTSVNALSEALRYWLSEYETAIGRIYSSNEGEIPSALADTKERENIPELLELFWGQDTPFNAKSPKVYGETAPVGCVGLAMAMAVNYQQYPERGVGSISYTNNRDKQQLTYDFSSKHFDYEKMLPYYIGDEDDEFIDAVAELCLACGMAVQSEYTETGTGANLGASIFSTYFNYPPAGLALLSRDYFTPEEWDDLVYEDLKNDCPVIYRGGSTVGTNGHAFVIDGYEDGLFHINWGWYGDANGYFNLSILRPGSSGTGSNSDDIYSASQQMVRGLRNPDKKVPTPIFTADSVSFDVNSGIFTVKSLVCRGKQNILIPGLKAENTETGEIIDIEPTETSPLTLTTGTTGQTISFTPVLKGLPDGNYNLRPAAKLTEDAENNPGNYLDYYLVYPTLTKTRFVNVDIQNGEVVSSSDGTDANHDIKFTNFDSATALISGSNLAFTMDAVNNGNTMIQSVNVWVYEHNSDNLAVSSGSRCNLILEPGNSGTFNLALPSMTNKGGTFDLQIKNTYDPSINYSERIPFTIANGNSYEIIDGIKYVVISEEEKTASAIRYSSSISGELVLPEKVEIKGQTYTLTELSNSFMNGASGLTKVTLPSSIKRIAGSSFNGCSSLKEINLPEGLEYVGGSCFVNCRELTSITIPQNIKSIGIKTFSSAGLTSVSLPEGLTSIGDHAFFGCKLQRIVLPSTVKSIGNYAFDNNVINTVICRATTPPAIEDYTFYTQTYRSANLFVPNESIERYQASPGWNKFKSYYQINEDRYAKVGDLWYELTQDFEAYVVPARENEKYTFSRVSIPDKINYLGMDYTVTEIKDDVFRGLAELTACTGGSNLRKIGMHAFDGCTNLTSSPIGNAVEEIGDYAFFNTNLGSRSSFPANLKRIGNYAFAGNKKLTYYKGLKEENYLPFPVSLISIGDGAFEGCETLNLLEIGSEIQLGENVFAGCAELKAIYLENPDMSVEYIRSLAESLQSTYFYIDGEHRQYFLQAFDRPEQLYDLLTVESIEWANGTEVTDVNEVKGITDVAITFNSIHGNPAVSSFIMKDIMFKDIGSASITNMEDYATTGKIIITLAPVVKTDQGHLQINFVQSGLSASMDFKIMEVADLIQAITLSETSKTLKLNEKYPLSATYSPDEVEDNQLVWTSSDPKVATVDANGNITAVGVGTTTISCKALMGLASAKCTVTVIAEPRPGKAIDEEDPDAPITVADVVAISNHIMGTTHEKFNETNADANRDGKISVSDVTTTVKIILGQGDTPDVNEAEAEIDVNPKNIIGKVNSVGENLLNFGPIVFENYESAIVSASLETMVNCTALQADIICPGLIEISNIELENLPFHLLSWKKLVNGNYRVVIYSLSNELLPVSPAPVLKLAVEKLGNAAGVITLTNAWISNPEAEKGVLYASGGEVEIPSGIGSLYFNFPEPYADVFTIDGSLLKRNVKIADIDRELSPGIYILRGTTTRTKIIVK